MPLGLTVEQRAALLVDCQLVAESYGGKCLSTAYINRKTKLHWECAAGHDWWAIPNNVRHATWCPMCYNERRGVKPTVDSSVW